MTKPAPEIIRYIEGSVRRSDDGVRITALLIDAETGATGIDAAIVLNHDLHVGSGSDSAMRSPLLRANARSVLPSKRTRTGQPSRYVHLLVFE
jgi:hypothetical protein